MPQSKKGLFIVIEGIDGSGKTSLVESFAEFLKKKKIPFVQNFEPTKENIFGITIREILHKKEISSKSLSEIKEKISFLKKLKGKLVLLELLEKGVKKIHQNKNLSEIERQAFFIADRYFDLRFKIKPALFKGKIVIQDRFDISSAAYALGTKGISPRRIFKMQEDFLKDVYLAPHIKIFMDLKPVYAIKRIKKERKDLSFYENLKKLQKIREAYLKVLKLKEKEGKTIYYSINPNKTKEEVFKDVYKLIFPSDKSL